MSGEKEVILGYRDSHLFPFDLAEDEDYEIIDGSLFSKLGRIPKVGERGKHQNPGFQIIAAGPSRITRLRLNITPANGDRQDAQAPSPPPDGAGVMSAHYRTRQIIHENR